MTYTILFTDSQARTSGIVVVDYDHYHDNDSHHPAIVRHAHEKGGDYARAYLLGEWGFPTEPFYVRRREEEGNEVYHAIDALQELLA